MSTPLSLHCDRLFPSEPHTRDIARKLYQTVKNLPIISPHGHTDPRWFAENENFANATELLIKPDHYLFRMLHSQGIEMSDLGLKPKDGSAYETDDRKIWHLFAKNYFVFRGTPTRLWLDSVFADVFGIEIALDESTADFYFDEINRQLALDEFKPRALFERFNIEVITTTESPLDDLKYHQAIIESDWQGKILTAFRPDDVTDPDYENFVQSIRRLGEITEIDVSNWQGYLSALKQRRQYFIKMGATSTDHSHPSARTANLAQNECEKLYLKVISESANADEKDLFRAQMLTEMAGMSAEDGLVMQVHPFKFRGHNKPLFDKYGRDRGHDIPSQFEFTENLQPLLNKYGCHPNFTLIIFTIDESVYARELAPLAGHYPALKIGPSWWFHDSPEGMRRFKQQVIETAGFYNTVGFNDDTRAFFSIPARHDVARRMDSGFLAELVADHRLNFDEACEIAIDLTYNLAKKAYKL